MRSLAVSFAFLFIISAALVAGPPMSRIRIEVKDLENNPVDSASVVLKFSEGRSALKLGKKSMKTWETRTSQEGVARLPSIPQGKVRIQIIAKGYQTYGGDFDVNQDEQTIEIKLNPPQPQFSAHE
jgi:hypothetical protein